MNLAGIVEAHGFASSGWDVLTRDPPPRVSRRRIVEALLQEPAVLGLRTRRLLRDVRERFGAGRDTAITAIAIARRTAYRPVDSRETLGGSRCSSNP